MVVVHGAELVDIIVEAGESAKSLNRPGMQRLLGLIDSGEVQTVIVTKLDRLTRSVKDLDSNEQAVIAAIADMRASGTSLRRIASDLNNRGLRTRRGSPWRLESIARVVAAERRSCSA